jgi:hypothetical protein
MKTTEEWFNQLNEAYKDKALKNMTDPKAEHYTLAGAVSNGFVWSETPEGKDYWNGVFREVMYGEKFEPKSDIVESTLVEVPKKKKSVKSEEDSKKSHNLFEDFKTQSLESK